MSQYLSLASVLGLSHREAMLLEMSTVIGMCEAREAGRGRKNDFDPVNSQR